VPAALDPDVLFRRRGKENEPLDDELDDWDPVGVWPQAAHSANSFALPFDAYTRQPRPTVVAVVAVSDHAEVPAVLGWCQRRVKTDPFPPVEN